MTIASIFVCLTVAALLLTAPDCDAFSNRLRLLIAPRSIFTKVPTRIQGPNRLSMATSSVGTADLDWPNLGFEYRETNSFALCTFKDGKWGPIERRTDPYIKVHIGATALHYGQACFEGLKAFQCKDGNVRIFRPDENAKRVVDSCARICMPEIPKELFLDAVATAVKDNLAFVPPYGTGGALYIRPLMFGSGPRIGLQPADEYTFVVLVLPVADYYRGGLAPVTAFVIEDYDRAAPRGVGNVKVAGNYAADILPNTEVKKKGFPIALYLDAKTNSCVEEFSTSNFLAITKDGNYVTPDSDTILPSITNKSLMELAADEGHAVEKRVVPMQEVMDGKFVEAGACGTAVVVTPVDKIVYKDSVVSVGTGVGPVLRKLYGRIRRIQVGEEEDKFNWMFDV